MKKISLYYQDMYKWGREFQDGNEDYDERQVIVFKTSEGGFGLRRQQHGWTVGDTVWTPDGKLPTTVIAVTEIPSISRLELLSVVLKDASYYVNRFADETSRKAFLNKLENELVHIATPHAI